VAHIEGSVCGGKVAEGYRCPAALPPLPLPPAAIQCLSPVALSRISLFAGLLSNALFLGSSV
jgi:hypothetical protein